MKRQRIALELHEDFAPLDWGGFIIRPTDPKHTDLEEAPWAPGIYGWYSGAGDLMYVGRSVNIHKRLQQHMIGTAFMGNPTYFSFRPVPECYLARVEMAHIRALNPHENMAREGATSPFSGLLEAEIERLWAQVLPEQKARLNAAYTRLAEQIAARL